jgi:hypothetical protein
MKQIPLAGNNSNYYHTKKDVITGQVQKQLNGRLLTHPDGEPLMQLMGKSTVTGAYLGEINEGDQLVFNPRETHVVTKVLERRNHNGIWEGGKDDKNRYYKVETEFNYEIKR